MRRFLWEAGFWTAASLLLLGVGCLFHYVLVPALAPGLERQSENRSLFRSLMGWPGNNMILHPFLYGLVFAAADRARDRPFSMSIWILPHEPAAEPWSCGRGV